MGIKNLTFTDNAAPPCDAAWLNSAKSEVNNTITSTGVSLSDANLSQLAAAIAEYSAGSDFYNETGVADAYVVAPIGSKAAPTQYFTGMRVRTIVGNTSTGASTINVNGLGVKTIKLENGSSDVTAGDIPAGVEVTFTYDGTNFRVTNGNPSTAETNPTGAVIAFAGTTAPSGWLLCAGQAVSRTTFADLFAVIATSFGVGDGSTTFNLPDLRGRTVVGLDNLGGSSANRITSANADTLNNTGFGSETDQGTNGNVGNTTLTASQVPDLDIDASYWNSATAASGQSYADPNKVAGGISVSSGLTPRVTYTITGATNGGGGSHTHTGSTWTGTTGANAQPSLALGAIIKT